MAQSRFFYIDAYVVKITPWQESRTMISLISAERGLITVGWKTPVYKKSVGREKIPMLFAKISAVIHHVGDEKYRLRSFQSLEGSFRNQGGKDYLGLCLLAKCTLKLAKPSFEYRYFYLIWSKLVGGRPLKVNRLFSELLFSEGLWPSFEFCEICSKPLQKQLSVEHDKVCCHSCGNEKLSEKLTQWLNEQFLSRKKLELAPFEDKLLGRFLLNRLGLSLSRDGTFMRLLNHYENEPHSN